MAGPILAILLGVALAAASPASAQTSVAGRYTGSTPESGGQIFAALRLSGPNERLTGSLSVFSSRLAATLVEDLEVTGTASGSVIFLTFNDVGFTGTIETSTTMSFDLGPTRLVLERLPARLSEIYTGRVFSGLQQLQAIMELEIAGERLSATVTVTDQAGALRIDRGVVVLDYTPSSAIEVREVIASGQPSAFEDVGLLLSRGEAVLFRELGRLNRFDAPQEEFRGRIADIRTDPLRIITQAGEVIQVATTTVLQDERGVFIDLPDLALGSLLEVRGRRLPLGDFAAETVILLAEDGGVTPGGAPGLVPGVTPGEIPGLPGEVGELGPRVVVGSITAVRSGGGTDRIISVGVLEFTVSEATPVTRNDGTAITLNDLAAGQSVRLQVDDQNRVISILVLRQGREKDVPNLETLRPPDETDVPNREVDQLNTELDDPG
ncbi:MAG: hypothetical protein HYY96_10725 [Candidatus Tectomicrobia bacterium]|nr:hypothetical protein [Candidatus Tectomicrobia bacterium]